MSKLTYGSVCSGIEAATAAWHPLGWTPNWFSEIEKFPSAVLAHHYPNVSNYGDMTKFKDWPDDKSIDLLVGGTPCQSFSVAGLRTGLDDPRGNLMLTYLAIAARYRPRWLAWENVPGVLSSNGGRDFGTFLWALGELGYGFAYRTLDAQYFGVAQRRRRVFVVGYLGDWRRAAAVLFERHSLSGNTAPRREKGERIAPTVTQGPPFSRTGNQRVETEALVAKCLTARGAGAGNQDPETSNMIPIAFGAQNSAKQGLSASTEVSPTLDRSKTPAVTYGILGNWIGRKPENGGNATTPMHNVAPNLTSADRHAVAFSFDSLSSNSMKSKNPKSGCRAVDLAKTIDTTDQSPSKNQGGLGIAHEMKVRRLTPIECERLQGFPDNFTQIPYRNKDAEQCPDGPRYKAIGNSMAVPVMKWIGERINMVEDIS